MRSSCLKPRGSCSSAEGRDERRDGGIMRSDRSGLSATGLACQVLLVLVAGSFTVMAQSQAASSKQATAAKVVGQPPSGERTELDDQYFREIYRDFYNHYKLGPEDQIEIGRAHV